MVGAPVSAIVHSSTSCVRRRSGAGMGRRRMPARFLCVGGGLNFDQPSRGPGVEGVARHRMARATGHDDAGFWGDSAQSTRSRPGRCLPAWRRAPLRQQMPFPGSAWSLTMPSAPLSSSTRALSRRRHDGLEPEPTAVSRQTARRSGRSLARRPYDSRVLARPEKTRGRFVGPWSKSARQCLREPVRGRQDLVARGLWTVSRPGASAAGKDEQHPLLVQPATAPAAQ